MSRMSLMSRGNNAPWHHLVGGYVRYISPHIIIIIIFFLFFNYYFYIIIIII